MSSITIGKIVQLVEDPYQTVADFLKNMQIKGLLVVSLWKFLKNLWVEKF